jgi:hypothetical protein
MLPTLSRLGLALVLLNEIRGLIVVASLIASGAAGDLIQAAWRFAQ